MHCIALHRIALRRCVQIADQGYTRIPVYHEVPSNVVSMMLLTGTHASTSGFSSPSSRSRSFTSVHFVHFISSI